MKCMAFQGRKQQKGSIPKYQSQINNWLVDSVYVAVLIDLILTYN